MAKKVNSLAPRVLLLQHVLALSFITLLSAKVPMLSGSANQFSHKAGQLDRSQSGC